MRLRSYPCPPPRFQFWSRGELLRLSVIAAACAIPILMPVSQPGHDGRTTSYAGSAPAPSAGRLRAVRVTRLDVTTTGALALGDADDAN